MTSTKTTLYLIRHCPYKNPKKILPGHLAGFPLSTQGQQCAKKLAEFLQRKNIQAIYTSPILRCFQTATIIGKQLKLKPHKSQQLEEIKSPLDGIDLKIFNTRGGILFYYKRHFEAGGESLEHVFKRVKNVLDQLLKTHTGQNIVMVSHGDPIMLLIYGMVDKDVQQHLKRSRKYIPMGGIAKLVFSSSQPPEFSQLNY